MSDFTQPFAEVTKATHNNSETVFTATAKPPKEKPHPDIGVVGSLDSIAEGLQESDTIDSSIMNDITGRIEKNQDRLDGKTRSAVKDNLVLLKQEMDALEMIEVADALGTIDSPWGILAQDVAQSVRLQQSLPDTKKREQYVDKLLFPFGAELYRDIRSMTTDLLTRQLMFHSIANDIRSHPERIRVAQASIPQPKDSDTVKNSMRRVALSLLGVRLEGHESETQIDSLYKKNIHTAVLRSRLSAEQPIFDLASTDQALKAATLEADWTIMPFAKEEAAQTLREIRTEQTEMKRIRHIINQELPYVYDETSLMQALDKVQAARFEGTSNIAPYKFESWVPESVRRNARLELEMFSKPKEDMYAKVLKKFDAAERRFRSGQVTWSETKYKDHMKWLADPEAQANRNQRIINIIDLVMTLTTLVSGVTGGIQRQIEGGLPTNSMSITDYIDYIESQRPWEVAADFATPKQPKQDTRYRVA